MSAVQQRSIVQPWLTLYRVKTHRDTNYSPPRFMNFVNIHLSYTQEIPTRFKKEIVRAAGPNSIVVAAGLERVLHNIGAANMISAGEMQSIFAEMGNEKGEIPAQKLAQLL